MIKFFKASHKASKETQEAQGLFSFFKSGLQKTRDLFYQGLGNLFLGKKEIDAELLDALETFLLSSDVGVSTTQDIMKTLTERLARHELKDPEALALALKTMLTELLQTVEVPLKITDTSPFVILMVGINGAGKTTTIGKLAKKLQQEGKRVLLAAGDTFRAAATEQLQSWGQRNQIPVIAQQMGADSASVIFDALQAAKAKNIDVLIADTAGRLHTQDTLMEELKKIVRVLRKLDPAAPHEILLVLDGGTGQNALSQAKKFHETLGITGLAITKLEGTAKAGMIFNIAKTLQIPIRYLGFGEGIDDLKVFEALPFIEALYADN